MDGIIDEMVYENNYTDDQIIERLSSLTGLGKQKMTQEEVDKQEKETIEKLRKKLRKQGGKAAADPLGPHAFDPSPDMKKFEDFQDRAGKMMYQGDQILLEKWENEERLKRKRSLEPKT